MEFEDISKMMRVILAYVKEYPGRVIVSDDVPKDLLFGFTLRDKDPFLLDRPTWRIRACNFRSSVAKLPEKPRDILIDYFYSAHKRKVLADLLTKGLKPSEMSIPV